MSKKDFFLWGLFVIIVFFAGLIKGYFIPLEIKKKSLHRYDKEALVITSRPELLPDSWKYFIENKNQLNLQVDSLKSFNAFRAKITEKRYYLAFIEQHWIESVKELLVPLDFKPPSISIDFFLGDRLGLPLLWGFDGFIINRKQNPSKATVYLSSIKDHAEIFSTKFPKQQVEIQNEFQTPKELWQMSFSKASHWMQKHPEYTFWVPESGGGLWVFTVSIPQNTPDLKLSLRILESLFTPQSALGLSHLTQEATTFERALKLIPEQRAEALRKIDLKQIIPLRR